MRTSRLLLLTLIFLSQLTAAQSVTIAQLSDIHIGIANHPGSEERLQQAIDLIGSRHVDAVFVSGDIGDKFEESWNTARTMLKSLNLPMYYVPGNHDDTAQTQSRYTAVFGPNYYTFRIRGINFVALDSQLLGNFSTFQSATPLPVVKEDEPAAEKMLAWLNSLRLKGPVIALQHVPPDRPSLQTSPDDKPYWILHDPWRTRELDALRKLGVKDILAGHWHQATLYEVDGIQVHVGPATSWSPKSPLGFALHTISPDGQVRTEFIYFQQQPFLK
jgi:predicted MPP superfamily phosphohydrolase